MPTDAAITRTGWFKSPRSAGDSNCVEISHLSDGDTDVRHSKHPDGLVLTFAANVWSGLLETIAAQPFPLDTEWLLAQPDQHCSAQARHLADGSIEFTHSAAELGQSLTFTADEWDAFIGGVCDGKMAWRMPEPELADA